VHGVIAGHLVEQPDLHVVADSEARVPASDNGRQAFAAFKRDADARHPGRTRSRAIPGRRWDPTSPWRDMTGWSSVAARSLWRATSANARGCRSPRSLSGWAAHRRRSRLTSTT